MNLKKRLYSFGYAWRGLQDLLKSQPNAQIHALATFVVFIAGSWVGLDRWEWVAIALCIALVMALEAINTALEYLTDLVSPDYHPLAGKAKDVAAGAVLFAAIMAVVVAAIIFLPKLDLC
jgi:diacylglycerol kinase